MGEFVNWMGPERIVMNTVRLYDEFKGTLTPDLDKDGTKQAIEEYDSIKGGGQKSRTELGGNLRSSRRLNSIRLSLGATFFITTLNVVGGHRFELWTFRV